MSMAYYTSILFYITWLLSTHVDNSQNLNYKVLDFRTDNPIVLNTKISSPNTILILYSPYECRRCVETLYDHLSTSGKYKGYKYVAHILVQKDNSSPADRIFSLRKYFHNAINDFTIDPYQMRPDKMTLEVDTASIFYKLHIKHTPALFIRTASGRLHFLPYEQIFDSYGTVIPQALDTLD